mmetsp:Transcript_50794/g.101088  ORF Transcript_50794/g.101088 Transcript_50794/m.101088 type:complete len:85 (+) Transcript_50794:924-1178(+)
MTQSIGKGATYTSLQTDCSMPLTQVYKFAGSRLSLLPSLRFKISCALCCRRLRAPSRTQALRLAEENRRMAKMMHRQCQETAEG